MQLDELEVSIAQKPLLSNKQDGTSLFNVLIVASFARDIFELFCIKKFGTLRPTNDPRFIKLATLQHTILTKVAEAGAINFKNKIFECTPSLRAAEMGRADIVISNCYANLAKFLTRVMASMPKGEEILYDSRFGSQFFINYLRRGIGTIVDNLQEEAKQKVKIEKEKKNTIDNTVTNLALEDNYIKIYLNNEIIEPYLEAAEKLIQEIGQTYGFEEIYHSLKAITRDLLQVAHTIGELSLTENETYHMAQLLINHKEKQGQGIPPDIIKMLYALPRIQPILDDYTLDTLENLLSGGCFSNKAEFIKRVFDANAPIYKTYEGLGNASACNLSLLESLLGKMLNELRAENTNKELIRQVGKYKRCITEYFQIPMRVMMPLDSLLGSYQKIYNKILPGLKDNPRLESICRDLTEAVKIFATCSDMLKQKTLVINALAGIRQNIGEIETYLATAKSPKTAFFHTNYNALLVETKQCFINLESDDRFADPSFVASQLRTIALRYKISEKTLKKDPSKQEGGKAVFLTIYQRFVKNAERLGMLSDDIKDKGKQKQLT